MENRIFSKIPTEIRLNIYDEVFKNATITAFVDWQDDPPPHTDGTHTIRYKFSPDYGLAFTCHAMKADSSGSVWRGAVVKTVAEKGGYPAPINRLSKALPSDIARQVRFLSKVTFLPLKAIEWENIEDASTSLLKFPSLKACAVPDCYSGNPGRWATRWGSNSDLFRGYVKDSLSRADYHGDRDLETFGYRRWAKPQEYLEARYGIKVTCGVQILSKQSFRHDDDSLRCYRKVCICFLQGLFRGLEGRLALETSYNTL